MDSGLAFPLCETVGRVSLISTGMTTGVTCPRDEVHSFGVLRPSPDRKYRVRSSLRPPALNSRQTIFEIPITMYRDRWRSPGKFERALGRFSSRRALSGEHTSARHLGLGSPAPVSPPRIPLQASIPHSHRLRMFTFLSDRYFRGARTSSGYKPLPVRDGSLCYPCPWSS